MSLGVMADNLSPTKANFYFKIIKLGLLWWGGPHKGNEDSRPFIRHWLSEKDEERNPSAAAGANLASNASTQAEPLDPFTLSLRSWNHTEKRWMEFEVDHTWQGLIRCSKFAKKLGMELGSSQDSAARVLDSLWHLLWDPDLVFGLNGGFLFFTIVILSCELQYRACMMTIHTFHLKSYLLWWCILKF